MDKLTNSETKFLNFYTNCSPTNNLIEQEKSKYEELNNLMMIHLQKAGQTPWQKPEAK
ncbi:MAG: hypothetical protein KTR26_17965 [Flammeovirgaceae bacterium]|nr:hypothetical protein [Flammeovirgaceae bacterium]